ncbi:hypothetical protein B0T22DRAFT_458703 [Podospora appendiculata]|uniref:Uncharacterized protein n=1 Tax=Podospora appendiculata TaxID=314037 RepID=A0AAE0X8S3_9PEZI|nr:hypothetical protein B0T22DRAFT_458703 [Podospora appendiculata]
MAPTAQNYCWKVCLQFKCGCTEYTNTAHTCSNQEQKCSEWMTYKKTDKECDVHRIAGLHGSSSSSGSSSQEQAQGQEHR